MSEMSCRCMLMEVVMLDWLDYITALNMRLSDTALCRHAQCRDTQWPANAMQLSPLL